MDGVFDAISMIVRQKACQIEILPSLVGQKVGFQQEVAIIVAAVFLVYNYDMS